MSNTTYQELVDDVLPALTADPSQPLVLHAIKRAVIEFCAGSWVWRVFPDPATMVVGQAEYDLDLPAGTDCTTLFDVLVDTVPLKNRTTTWLDRTIPGWRTTPADPKYFTQLDTDRLLLAPVPDRTLEDAITMTLVLQPSQTATGFPRWIASQFFYGIADGAIARLLLMPNRPWSDPLQGAERLANFNATVAGARHTGAAALARAPVRVAYQH